MIDYSKGQIALTTKMMKESPARHLGGPDQGLDLGVIKTL